MHGRFRQVPNGFQICKNVSTEGMPVHVVDVSRAELAQMLVLPTLVYTLVCHGVQRNNVIIRIQMASSPHAYIPIILHMYLGRIVIRNRVGIDKVSCGQSCAAGFFGGRKPALHLLFLRVKNHASACCAR
jgi:hypothetical protein